MVFLTGTGPPANITGTIGDVYIDTATNLYYGPKQTPLEWPPTSVNFSIAVLRHGANTPLATFGNIGEFYLDYVNMAIYGPKTSGGWGQGSFLRNNGLTMQQAPPWQEWAAIGRRSNCGCKNDDYIEPPCSPPPCDVEPIYEDVFDFSCQPINSCESKCGSWTNSLRALFGNVSGVTLTRIAIFIIIVLLIAMILKK